MSQRIKNTVLILSVVILVTVCWIFLFFNSSIDFKKNNLDAAKILTEFLIQFSKDMDFYMYKNITPERIRAVFVDLNGDGVDEVVGYSRQADDLWLMGTQLFILEKRDDGKYKNAGAAVNFFPRGGVKILPHKTNGYHDLKIKSIYLEDTYCSVEDFIIKYDAENRAYYNPQQIKQLVDILE